MNNENLPSEKSGEFLVNEIKNWINNLTNNNQPETERILSLIAEELYNQNYIKYKEINGFKETIRTQNCTIHTQLDKIKTLKQEIKLLKEINLECEKPIAKQCEKCCLLYYIDRKKCPYCEKTGRTK